MEFKDFDTVAAFVSAMAGAIHTAGPEAKPYVILPPNWSATDVEKHLPKPMRKTGHMGLASAESFVDYIKRHIDPKTTILLADEEKSYFKAIFNHHSNDAAAGWGDHTASYSCPLSKEWRIWVASNTKEMKQEDFAQFIEDNVIDILEPSSADMLEVSRTLQAKKKVDFASAIRLDNGQNQFTYNEEVSGTAGGKGQLSIPEQFTIGIPVYTGGPAYRMPVRFRYRIKDGALTIWYDILRPHKVLEAAFKDVKTQIATGSDLAILAASIS